jgi:type IV pilus assembly protein PilM
VARRSIGLDIGTRAVHMAEVEESRGGIVVTNFGGVALPDQAVREGDVLDPGAVAQAIKQLFSAAKLKAKQVAVGVANQRVVVRQIDLPWMEEVELRTSLPFQVQEFIPIPVEEAELDFHVLDVIEQGDAKMLRLLLVAAHKDMVAGHMSAVTLAGLKPVGVDLNPFALLRSMGSVSTLDTGPEVLIDIGAGVTDIVVHERGVPTFVRILVLGGDDITDAIASGMSMDRDTAEELKHATTARGEGPDATVGRVVDDHARQFVDEIRGSLDYYRTQVGSASPLSRIVLTGGGSLLAGLADRLAEATNLPVELGNPFDRLQAKGTAYGPEELAQVGPTLATAIGLAMWGLE